MTMIPQHLPPRASTISPGITAPGLTCGQDPRQDQLARESEVPWARDIPAPARSWGHLPCLRGRYVVHEAIARGGVFHVYRAWDLRMQREVAIKMMARQITDDDAQWALACSRFAQEAFAMMLVQHPTSANHTTHHSFHDQTSEISHETADSSGGSENVVKCYGLIRTPRAHYIVMEYLEGVSLRRWLEQRRPDMRQMYYIIYSIGRGLERIHNAGLVHRDIKPENIMVTRDKRVVLIDLGIAYEIKHGYTPEEDGLVRGTPGYLAPEQLHCAPLSPATDIYALGTIIYEMITGQPLFAGQNIQQLIMAQMAHRIPSMRGYAKDPLWQPFVMVLKRCLKRSPEARLDSFPTLWKALTGRDLSTTTQAKPHLP